MNPMDNLVDLVVEQTIMAIQDLQVKDPRTHHLVEQLDLINMEMLVVMDQVVQSITMVVEGGAGGAGGDATTGGDANAAGDGGNGQPFPGFTGPLIGVPALNPLGGVYGGGGGSSVGSDGGYNPPIAPAGTGGPGGGGTGGGAGAGDEGASGVQYSGGGGGGGHRSPENTKGGELWRWYRYY